MAATSSPISEELSTDLMLTNITGNTGYILEYWKYGKIWVLIISKVPRLLNNSILSSVLMLSYCDTGELQLSVGGYGAK